MVAMLLCAVPFAVPVMAEQADHEYSRDDLTQAKYGQDFAEVSAETAGQVQAIYNRQPFPADAGPADVFTREEIAEWRYDGSFEESTLADELTREQLVAVQNAYDAQFGDIPDDPAYTRDDIAQAKYGYDFDELSTETAGQVQAIYNRQPFAEGTSLEDLLTREEIAEDLYGEHYFELDDREQRIAVENRYASQFGDGADERPTDDTTATETETDSAPETTETESAPETTETESAPETDTASGTESPTETETPATAETPTDRPTETDTPPATETPSPTATATETATDASDGGTSDDLPDLVIIEINAEEEWVEVRNDGNSAVQLGDYRINYEAGNDNEDQIRDLPEYTLEPGETVTIGTGEKSTGDVDIDTGYQDHMLHNTEPDTVQLLTADGQVIDEQQDQDVGQSLLADPVGLLAKFLGSLF